MRSKPKENTILEKIVMARRGSLAITKRISPLSKIELQAASAPPPISFEKAIASSQGISIIAEMKRKSPSAGTLDMSLKPSDRAQLYCEAGAAAISVLTEPNFFAGTMDDLVNVKSVASKQRVAVLQKDFLFDPYQVYEARANGADAILLIISILDPVLYKDLLELAKELDMSVLVEVFDREELEIAIDGNPGIIGINNRNLKTLETSLNTFLELSPHIPNEKLKVAESGMKRPSDVRLMGEHGAKAVLVGESLMRAGFDAKTLISEMNRVSIP